MPPPRRSALEVSFPELADQIHEQEAAAAQPQARFGPSVSGVHTRKDAKRKKVNSTADTRAPKRRHTPNKENSRAVGVKRYIPRDNIEIPEEKAHIFLGDDDDSEDGDDKPVRVLSNFCFFDPKHGMELVSLADLEKDDGILDREFEGVGDARPFTLNDEDAGQEDDLDDQVARIKLSAILRYTMDYTKENDPAWIETMHAWYVLEKPSKFYQQYFRTFFRPQRIAQIVISSVLGNEVQSFAEFLASFVTHKIAGQFLQEDDLWTTVSDIRAALEGLEDCKVLANRPVLRHILRKGPPVGTTHTHTHHRSQQIQNFIGNLDLAVLRTENQTITHVTPRIDMYATGFFRESLMVVGPPPVRPRGPSPAEEKEMRARLHHLLAKAADDRRPDVVMRPNKRLKPRSVWLSEVEINGEVYKVGDNVIVPIGQNGKQAAPKLPSEPQAIPQENTLTDYFWFAKVIYIDSENQRFHVQWFEHSSKTAMGEISDAQELFITDICDGLDFDCIVGKATVHQSISGRPPTLDHNAFFCQFAYDSGSAVFKDIDLQRIRYAECDEPPDNCPVCLLKEQRGTETYSQKLNAGVGWHGVNYHIYDFVMIKAEQGPCHIGHIIDIRFPQNYRSHDLPVVTVKLMGRISTIKTRPRDVIKDERHLFFTDLELEARLEDVIGQCSVVHPDSQIDLSRWLSKSALHFYSRFKFPSLDVRSWNEKQALFTKDILMCSECLADRTAQFDLHNKFLDTTKPLRTFDPFGGVGAFGLGLEEAGCVKVTHAVEISPSASETMRRNSPHTIVYNQCANKVLKYAIKMHEGHQVENLLSLYDKQPLPPPPKPGDIDCIIAGFPCQPHSHLNMYQKANDIKSNLFLNALSWVDFLKPRYCIFENVRGFLSFNLNATQAGRYRVEGGIDMGGLKFTIRAMVAMNYQVRFGLLQAAHYGTPQSRVRFFLFAAKHGYPLPELPQPTHDFPLADALRINLTNGDSIEPIRTLQGTAPYHFVTVDDAIGDLPRFDWKNPARGPTRRNDEVRTAYPSIECDNSLAKCGPRNPVEYHHEPETNFQSWCRKQRTTDLQQFTRTYAKIKVERVVTIPLDPKADYRSLRPDLWEWHFANPASSVAKSGFRPGLYGRIDKDGWFATTVTNMDPTAKQSRVLNPYCKRIVTVRELARSQGFPDNFVFHSINNNVVTMHRQIGNAVPINLGLALGRELRTVLFKKWLADREDAIIID